MLVRNPPVQPVSCSSLNTDLKRRTFQKINYENYHTTKTN